jgi:hypothetical protein
MLRPAPSITDSPLQLSPAETAVRGLEREATAAAAQVTRRVEEWKVLDAGGAVEAARQAKAAEVDRARQTAEGLLRRALDARLDLDVPLVAGRGDGGVPGDGGGAGGATADRLDVVSWNHPEWSWEQLMAAALDEPTPTPPGEPTAGGSGDPSSAPRPPAGAPGEGSDVVFTPTSDDGRPTTVQRGTPGQIARPTPIGVPLDTGYRTPPDGPDAPAADRAR